VFDLGDTVPLGVQILDEDDQLVAPGAISLVVTQPDGTSMPGTTPANPATGIYTYAAVPTQAGRHLVRWTTTTPATAHTDTFDVSEAAPHLIVSLAEAKKHLNITDSTQDDELRAFIEGVTAVVENGDGRDFRGVGPVVKRTVTTRVEACGGAFVLPYTQIISLTSGTRLDGGGAVDVTGYTFVYGILRPPYGSWFPSSPWTLTYVVGLPDLPGNIRLGALEVLRNAWNSQRGSQADIPFLVPYRAASLLAPNVAGPGVA